VLLGNDGGGSWSDVRSDGSGEEWGKWRLQAWREKWSMNKTFETWGRTG
nr:hypothetical protein [Tanacetum cinerariifolium]